jgi:hypothetical protein
MINICTQKTKNYMIIGYFAVDFIEVENDQIINEHKINDINKKMKKNK